MKVITCKYCKSRVMKFGDKCPKCGKKFKKPWYLNPFLWFLFICLVCGIIINFVVDYNATKRTMELTDIYYSPRELRDLEDILNKDPLGTETVYKNKHLDIKGTVEIIGNHNKYFTIIPDDGKKFSIEFICLASTKEFKDEVKNLRPGDKVHLLGQVTKIDYTTYEFDIEKFEKETQKN